MDLNSRLHVHTEAPESDSWPVAVFEVTEANGEKVRNVRKLDFLKRMLNIEQEGIFNNGGGRSPTRCRALCSCSTWPGPGLSVTARSEWQ